MTGAPAAARAELAPGGTLRVGINTANAATVTVAADGSLSGPCIALAQALGVAAALPVELVRFASAGQLVAAEEAGDAWGVAFLAIDPARAARLHFTAPYLTIEAGFAVPVGSPVNAVHAIDRAGVRIATAAGAAYDMHLQRTLRAAERVVFPDPAAAFTAFEGGGLDAVAGVRAALEGRFATSDAVRILPGHFLAIRHAMAVPVRRRAAAAFVDRFVTERRE